ncbi:unnamed protein product [Sphagnum troendelagicum]|uniref:Uncharacterized protein n=1 Tax=Sphagnum troendelagicum TaxID=128251 RepID=A0ABP0UEK1_9BRYO
MGNSFSCCKRKDVDVSQGPPKKREGDVIQIHGLINTPPVLGENAPSSSRQGTHVKYSVHDLNPDCISKYPNLTIIFFHGIINGVDDAWKQTWTTCPIDGKEKCICWPQIWIPKDLNDNVKILSLSYDSNGVSSVHNDVTEIGQNLIQSLGILVPWASATRLSNNNNYKVEDANLLTICKPPSKDHLSYSKLLECLKICMKV